MHLMKQSQINATSPWIYKSNIQIKYVLVDNYITPTAYKAKRDEVRSKIMLLNRLILFCIRFETLSYPIAPATHAMGL